MFHLKQAKELRARGKILGRKGLSERVFALVDNFNEARTYKNAMNLAGRLKAISQAAKYDGYWDEKVCIGFQDEYNDLAVIASKPELLIKDGPRGEKE